MQIRRFLPLLVFTLLAPCAQAHFVWLEITPDGPAAFFGEWADDVRETQDGYLKIIAGPRAFAGDGSILPVQVGHDRLTVAGSGSADVRLTAHYRPEKGETFVRYHARLGRTDTRPSSLDLELVPVAAGGNAFTLIFQGQPLADTVITLFTAEGWSRKFRTDPSGRVIVLTPWPGQCVLKATHVEKIPGQHEGRAHESVRHVSTLTFVVDGA